MSKASSYPATLLDWSQVKSAISEFRQSIDLVDDAKAFQYFAISKILKIDDDEISAAITDGGDDRGIDAVFIDSRPEARRIHIFQFKHISEFKKRDKTFPSNEIDKILTFLGACFQQEDSLEETCNPLLWLKVQAIWASLDDATYSVQVHLCNNASKLTEAHAKRFREVLKPYVHADLSEHDLLWFSNQMSERQRDDRELSLPLVQSEFFGRTDGFAQGVIGTVRAIDIVEFVQDKDFPGEVDQSLFEENIRLYLGEDNDVNRKIFQSAVSKANLEFWYLNNGVTIVCDRYDYQPKSVSPKVRMKNPQIVNGGQTSHALFAASRDDAKRIEDVRILIRIIETEDRKLVNRIAEATNSQTPIRSRDIKSNDKIQIQIENALRAEGYFYERKNDQYIGEAREARIDAVKLGQIILSYVLREPDRAKTQSNRIFGEYYDWVFDDEILSSENVLTLWRVYRLVEEDRQRAIKNMSSRLRSTYSEAWIVEGIFHVLYMISLRADQAGIDKFDYPKIVSLYDSVKDEMESFIAAHPGKAAYRIFRAASTKSSLARLVSGNQLSLDFK